MKIYSSVIRTKRFRYDFINKGLLLHKNPEW